MLNPEGNVISEFNSVTWQKLKKIHVEKGLPNDNGEFNPLKTRSLKNYFDTAIEASYSFAATGQLAATSYVVSLALFDVRYAVIGTSISVMAAGFNGLINLLEQSGG